MTVTISWIEERERAVAEAAAVLRRGGVVGLPTETVYGLATVAGEQGERQLRELKGRDSQKPFTIAVGSVAAARTLPVRFPHAAERLAQKFWPGPLTLILPSTDRPGDLVGVRVPGSRAAREVLEAFGGPVLLTSLNRSGDQPAVRADEVAPDLLARLDLLVDAGESPIKEASTVVRFFPLGLQIDREGGILTGAMVLKHATEAILFVCSGNTCRSPMAAGLLRSLLGKKLGIEPGTLGSHGILVESAGLSAASGYPAAPEAIAVAAELGADVSEHVSRPVSESMLAKADPVFVMTGAHLRELRARYPQLAGRARLLDHTGRDISDPIGGTTEDYRRSAEHIAREISAWLDETWTAGMQARTKGTS